MARAAGFQAYPVRLAARNRYFFVKERYNSDQLNSLVVEVASGSTPKFFDPATIYCPYGLLPWEETGAGGVRVDVHDAILQATPVPQSNDAVIRRSGEFHLDAEGNLKGSLSVMYEGQEALQRRLRAIDQDDAARREDLEGEIKFHLPQGGSAKLLSAQGWTESETPLKAEFEIQVPSYASKAGQRLLVPVGILHWGGQQPFASARRSNGVYFDYPWESYEEVKVVPPPGFQIEYVPAISKIDRGRSLYELSGNKEGDALRLKRTMKMASYYVPAEKYMVLREFYEEIRKADEQQMVLKPLSASDKQ